MYGCLQISVVALTPFPINLLHFDINLKSNLYMAEI